MERFINKIENNVLLQLLNEAKIDRAIKDNQDIGYLLKKFSRVNPKYIPWIVREIKHHYKFNKPNSNSVESMTAFNKEMDDFTNSVLFSVEDFDRFAERGAIKNKDITSYYSFYELRKAAREGRSLYYKKQEDKIRNTPKSKVVFENEKWLAIQPLNKAASCKYGKGTKWCISAKDDDYNEFDNYTQRGDQILIIFNKINGTKSALLAEEGEMSSFYDEKDDLMPDNEIEKRFPDKEIQNVIRMFSKNNPDFFG